MQSCKIDVKFRFVIRSDRSDIKLKLENRSDIFSFLLRGHE